MKALLINGSPGQHGNTYIALKEVADRLSANGVESEIYWIGNKPVQGCIACNGCVKKGFCVMGDRLYIDVLEKLREADAFIVGSPTYFGGPTGSLCALLDRIFYSCARELVTMDIIGGKWKPIMIYHLRKGALRSSDIMRRMGGISNKMFTQTARELERAGIIERKVYSVVPPKVEYSLTELGKSALPFILDMAKWGKKVSDLNL